MRFHFDLESRADWSGTPSDVTGTLAGLLAEAAPGRYAGRYAGRYEGWTEWTLDRDADGAPARPAGAAGIRVDIAWEAASIAEATAIAADVVRTLSEVVPRAHWVLLAVVPGRSVATPALGSAEREAGVTPTEAPPPTKGRGRGGRKRGPKA